MAVTKIDSTGGAVVFVQEVREGHVCGGARVEDAAFLGGHGLH